MNTESFNHETLSKKLPTGQNNQGKIEDIPLGGRNFSDILKKNENSEVRKGLHDLVTPHRRLSPESGIKKTHYHTVTTTEFLGDFDRLYQKFDEYNLTISQQIDSVGKDIPDKIHLLEQQLSSFETRNRRAQKLILSLMVTFIAMTLIGLVLVKENSIKNPSLKIPPNPINQNDQFVSPRYLNLRNQPTTQGSRIIHKIPPNTIMSKLTQKGDWIQIQIQDYLNNTKKSGWVYSGNLVKVK